MVAALGDSRLDRRLGWAVALSLAVHGLALTPSLTPPAPEAGAPLRATLRQGTAAQGPSPEKPPTGEAVVEAATRQPTPETPAPVSSPVPSARAETASAAPAERPGEQGNPAAPVTENAPPAPPEAAPAPLRHGISLPGLRQYHMALGRMAARFKRYPPSAREAGLEGRVAMRLVISETGAPVGLSLIGTSGHPVLDQAAIEMMAMAATHTPVPETLLGQGFSIDLAVDYSLKDEQ